MNITRPQLGVRAGFVCLAAFLALEPVRWLYRTWTDPAFDSLGLWVFVGVVGLALWSGTSPKQTTSTAAHLWPALVVTAVVRAVGHVISIHVLAAFSLALDVYVLARLARLDQRTRQVSPAGLAWLFALSLPLERVLQRLVGFPLQWSAAAMAEPALAALSGASVERHGTRLLLDSVDVIVDLPCSGAQGLYLAAVLTVASLAVRPTSRRAALAVLTAGGVGAVAGNVLRIVLIALSAHDSTRFFGFDLTVGVGHELAGVVGLLAGLVPPVIVLRGASAATVSKAPTAPEAATTTHTAADVPRGMGSFAVARAALSRTLASPRAALLCMTVAAAVVVATPKRPLDVSQAFPELAAPLSLGGAVGQLLPLSAAEQSAYAASGGTARRIQYDDLTLVLIRTSAPLRHLHEPFECLRALGVRARRVGVSYETVPSAIYHVTTDDGDEWRIAVTYVSQTGVVATSVGEVVWRWLQAPSELWTAYQRVVAWDSPNALVWDAHVAAAFEFPLPTGDPI